MLNDAHYLYKLDDRDKPGWLAATRSEIDALKLNPGPNSRQSKCGRYIYLNEREDMPAFMKAHAAHYGGTARISFVAMEKDFIRALPRFSKA